MALPNDVASALADAARTINSPLSLEETLETIVRTARDTVPGIDEVGVTIAHRNGLMETAAATSDLVRQLDALQYDHGEGPCVYAIEGRGVVQVDRLRDEKRWPKFRPPAVALGVRAQLGIELYVDKQTLGGLNMYSVTTDVLPEGASQVAELFATHAALALGRAKQARDLNTAIVTRKVIGQAMGIVMERYGLNEDSAFNFLARVSQTSNIKLRKVAQEIVDQGNRAKAVVD
jgi:GAF domain-containing protein